MQYVVSGLACLVLVFVPVYILEFVWLRKKTQEEQKALSLLMMIAYAFLAVIGFVLSDNVGQYYVRHIAHR